MGVQILSFSMVGRFESASAIAKSIWIMNVKSQTLPELAKTKRFPDAAKTKQWNNTCLLDSPDFDPVNPFRGLLVRVHHGVGRGCGVGGRFLCFVAFSLLF